MDIDQKALRERYLKECEKAATIYASEFSSEPDRIRGFLKVWAKSAGWPLSKDDTGKIIDAVREALEPRPYQLHDADHLHRDLARVRRILVSADGLSPETVERHRRIEAGISAELRRRAEGQKGAAA